MFFSFLRVKVSLERGQEPVIPETGGGLTAAGDPLSVGAATVGDMAARTKSTKDRPSYRCTECGWQTAKWLGRCPECQAWGTVEEYGAPAVRTTAAGRVSTAAVPIGQVDGRQATARSTGVDELDRVLGGGWCPAPSCCSRASPASASPRCCSTWRPRPPATNTARSM